MKRLLIILALAAAPSAGAEEKSRVERGLENLGRKIEDTASRASKATGRGVQRAGKAVEKVIKKIEKEPDSK